MTSVVRIAAVTAASLCIALGAAPAASADSSTVEDKTSDVVMRGKVSGYRTATERSFAKHTDVTSTKISHGSAYVSVTIRFADLRADDQKTVQIDVARKSVTNTTGTVSHSFRLIGSVSEPRGPVKLYGSLGTERACAITATVSTGKNGFYKVQVPRLCLDSESKIKVRTSVFAVSGEGRSFKDFVSPAKAKTSAWSKWMLKG